MPKAVEQALMREAAKKGFTGERRDRYVYGYMQKHHIMLHNAGKGHGHSTPIKKDR